MGDSGLDEVSGAVEFMEVTEVGPALGSFIVHKGGVEVAIGLLGGEDGFNGSINSLLKFTGQTCSGDFCRFDG